MRQDPKPPVQKKAGHRKEGKCRHGVICPGVHFSIAAPVVQEVRNKTCLNGWIISRCGRHFLKFQVRNIYEQLVKSYKGDIVSNGPKSAKKLLVSKLPVIDTKRLSKSRVLKLYEIVGSTEM